MTVQLSALRVGAEFDASKYVAGATQKEAADRKMVASGREVAAAVSQSDTRLSQSGDVLSRLSRQYVDGYANAQKFNGAIASLSKGVERGKIEMQQASLILDGIYRKYGMMADATRIAERGQVELAQAVQRANTRFQEQKNIVPANDSVAGFRRQNLGYQAFDIGQGLASGMPIQMIAAQQLPQVAQLYAGAGGLKAALGDVASLATGAVSAIGGIPLALGLAGTAAVFYAKRNEVSLKDADNALAKHKANIEALGTAYGVAEQRAKSYSDADRAVANAAAQGSLQDLGKYQVQSARELRLQFGSMQTPGKGGQAFFAPFPDYKPFAEAFRDLDNGIRSGRVEGEKFIDAVSQIGKVNPQYETFANNILKAAQQFLQINKEASETRNLLTQIARLPPLDPLGAFDQQKVMDERAARTPSQFQQLQDRREAFRLQTFARTLAEKEAAARATAAAQFDPNENPTDRQTRIETAAYEARLAGERQLQDSQRERAINSARILADQQHEIDMLGKTGGQLVALRKEYELTSQLRLEAARQGIEVDQHELDLIKEKTKELGRLTDLYNQRRFEIDMGRQIADSRLSERNRGIVTTLRQYGLPEDLNGANAQMLGKQYDWQQAKDLAKGFGSAFSSELISGSHNIGKAFLKGFESAVTNAATKMWEEIFDNLGNAFADWVTGGSKGSSGGLVGGTSSIASSVMSSTTVAANDNKPVSGSGAALAWNFWKSKGLADHQVAGILGNIKAESAFNPAAIGDSGAAKGLYQWNDRSASMLASVGSDWRNNPLAQHEFAYRELMGSEGKAWNALTNAKDVRGATTAFAGFERPQGFSWGNPEGAHNFSGRLAGAEQALTKFGGTATQATQSLGGFGNGLSQVGNALSGAGGGAGGIFGLTSLGLGIFNKSGQFASAMLGGGLGLFADGTESAPGGLAMVGERGRELVRLPRGSQVVPNHRTESMVSANRNTRAGRGSDGPQTLQVVIQGASGDAHIRKLVEQGVNSALADQNVVMRRGAFGSVNKAYTDDKG